MLIQVYNELNEKPADFTEYLTSIKCCAFCKNYGKRYNCPVKHEDDFVPYDCDHFLDAREEMPLENFCKEIADSYLSEFTISDSIKTSGENDYEGTERI